LAKEHGLSRLAFPAISCGVYGYPLAEACSLAVQECLQALAQQTQLQVTLVAYSAEVADVYQQALQAHCG
jgi:O-acetyl-ADP-ribose deacetylase (regulator of RNase III)